jgi:hypothetical protein
MAQQPPSTLALRLSAIYTTLSDRPVIALAILLLTTIIITRLLSSKQPEVGPNGSKRIPAVSYTLPILGHLPSMFYDAKSFTRNLRSLYYADGAYSLNFGGTVHNILFAPSLATALVNVKAENANELELFRGIMGKVFGFPLRSEGEKYDAVMPSLNALYKHFMSDPGLSEMTARAAQAVKSTISSFVTGSPSLVDQMLWERNAAVEIKTDASGDKVVEVDLLDLSRDWCAHNANPTIFGSDFVNNFPDYVRDMWTLDDGFLLLATGLPRWIPIPSLTKAHIARRNLLNKLVQFEVAMDKFTAGEDPGPEWRDLEDVGPVVKGRIALYREHGLSMQARASVEFGLLWAANANSNATVFWMLERIYADKALLALLREEIEPYVRAVQPKQEFIVPDAPRLEKLDAEGLCASCPLLKSCYIECLRLDAAPWSLKVAQQDFVLTPRDKEAQSYMFRKGEYVHVAHDLHNTDPNVFENPDVFKADRHVKYDENGKGSADMGSMRPYGMSPRVFRDGDILLTSIFQVVATACAKDVHSLSKRSCSSRQRSSQCGKLTLLTAVNGKCPDTAKRQRRTAQVIQRESGSSRENCRCRRRRSRSVIRIHFFHDRLIHEITVGTAFAGGTAVAVVEVGEVYHAVARWKHGRLHLSFLLSFLLAVLFEGSLFGWFGGRVEPKQSMK